MEWTLANIIRTHAATRGGKAMLTYAGLTTSYAEMDAASSRVAQGLLAEGIGPQDRVAFLDKNGPEYFEVLFGGAKIQNMKGYWNKEEETARVFTADGWLKTGDAGFMDAEGYVFLTDRVKDMIVSGGENIYPAEVENALSGHPALADVAVIGVPHDRWGETVKAIVVKQAGTDPRPEEIIEYARQRLAHYKCPTSVDFVDALPRNPSGKLLKRQLREPYWKGHERRIH